MKKKMRKQICLLLTFIMVVTACTFNTYATEDSQSQYKESHAQINYKHSELRIIDNDLCAVANQDNFIEKYLGNKECDKTNRILKDYEGVSEKLTELLLNNDEICAIAYTEAPIAIYNDHTERIEKEKAKSLLAIILSGLFPVASAVTTKDGDIEYQGEGNFALITIISKQDNGSYNTITMASWEKGSFIGGKKYPASGNDYILQAIPSSFTRQSHDFYCLYNQSSDSELVNAYEGTNGKEYFVTDGDNTYIKIAVKDDPFGMARLSLAILTANNIPNSYSGSRTINSYYVHTWKSMSISVSVSVDTEEKATLIITPSINEKSWQVYSYVTFEF